MLQSYRIFQKNKPVENLCANIMVDLVDFGIYQSYYLMVKEFNQILEFRHVIFQVSQTFLEKLKFESFISVKIVFYRI